MGAGGLINRAGSPRARGSRPSRRSVLAVTVAAVAAGIVAACLLRPSPESAIPDPGQPPRERRVAPELGRDWLVGPPTRLADLRGKPALVNFWASWCAPCREEAGVLARFDASLRGRARLIGVQYRDAPSDGRAFVREFGWRFPSARDPKRRLGSRYRLAGLPTTYVLDRRGRIARVLTGPQTLAELRRAVRDVERG